MLAVCMFRSRRIDDIVVWSNEAEGEGDDHGKDKREDNGGQEGVGVELFVVSATFLPK